MAIGGFSQEFVTGNLVANGLQMIFRDKSCDKTHSKYFVGGQVKKNVIP